MALSIPFSDSSWFETNITLNGKDYLFTFHFNDMDQRWRITISQGSTPIIGDLKIIESGWLLEPYRMEEFDHGDFICLRMKDDKTPASRDNIGVGKSYELIYFSKSELEALRS